MKYDKDRKVIREILKTADIANTINGGMSQPVVDFSKKADHYLLSVKVPGVDVKSLNVEVIDKYVVVNHPLMFNQNSEVLEVPYVVTAIPISIEMDYKKITASEENDVLKIIVPFTEISGGYRKKVEINR